MPDEEDLADKMFREKMFRCNHPTTKGTLCRNKTDPGFTAEDIGSNPMVMVLIANVASGRACPLHVSESSQEAEVGRAIEYAIIAAKWAAKRAHFEATSTEQP